MTEECSICMCPMIARDIWVLRCGHIFHPLCIRTVYDKTINRIDEATLLPLKPSCPMCRADLHSDHIPSRRRLEHFQRLREPAYAQMSANDRPLRLSRETFILNRENAQRSLDRLMEQRAEMLARRLAYQACDSGSTNDPSASDNHGTDDENVPTSLGRQQYILESDSEDSVSSVPSIRNDQDSPCADVRSCSTPPLVIDEYYRESQLPVQGRGPSRSSPSLPANPCDMMQNDHEELSSVTTMSSAPASLINFYASDLQTIQMHIGILRNQIEEIDLLPARTLPDEQVVIPDNVSESSCDNFCEADPLRITHHYGRGRNTKYLVLWSDDVVTANPKYELETVAPDLLVRYRKERQVRNTRRFREIRRSLQAS
jgi:hypothetical protein